MNKCTECGKECQGVCCSGACRARKSRRTRTQQGARPMRTDAAHADEAMVAHAAATASLALEAGGPAACVAAGGKA